MRPQKKASLMQLSTLVLFACACLSWHVSGSNALMNTKWKGILNIPSPSEGVLVFKKDSGIAYYNNHIIETMSYKLNGDTIILRKLSGGSPCNNESGSYKFNIKNDVLTLSVLQDNCEARISTFSPEGYKKQAE
jgi:hypothetical protein